MLGLWQVFVGMAESLVPESGSEGATSKAKVAWQGLEVRAWVNLKGFLWILWMPMFATCFNMFQDVQVAWTKSSWLSIL